MRKKRFKNLKEILKLAEIELETGDKDISAILDYEDLVELKELMQDWVFYSETMKILEERKYYKKYLKERRKEEPNLLYPDADEIYERYFEQKAEIEELKQAIGRLILNND